MKHSEHERLLREVVASDEIERLRATSLESMLGVARRRRRRRTWASGAAASLAVVMTILGLTHREARSPATVVAPAATLEPSVKIINDDQLLALFPDRALALVGRPGDQRLLFLDGEERLPAQKRRR
jgi:hypothetical protein